MRGAKPGERRGGRTKGTPNKTTNEERVEVVQTEQKIGRRLAIDRLAEAVEICFGMAARYQQGKENEKDFRYWMKEGMWGTAQLAPYQSARLQATTLTANVNGGLTHRLEIEIVPSGKTPDEAISARSLSPVIEHESKV